MRTYIYFLLTVHFLNLCGNSFAQHSIKLLTYNIRNAKGMDNSINYNRTAAVIKNVDADITALQEVDSATRRSGRKDVLKILADKTNLNPVYGAAIPYQDGKYGVGILSKKKARKYYSLPLPGREEERVLLVAVFKKYVIFCTHLSLTSADALASATIINKESEKFKKPIYLLGDLNSMPGSDMVALLHQKWTLLSGEAFTFPADVPTRCIDYIFVSNTTPVTVGSKKVLDEPMASDHRPVMVKVKINGIFGL